MAKKRGRKAVKRSPRRSRGREDLSKKGVSRKIRLVLSNLLFFFVLFVLSLVLYSVSGNEFYVNLFSLLAIIFGFLALAFLIALLIFLFVKLSKK